MTIKLLLLLSAYVSALHPSFAAPTTEDWEFALSVLINAKRLQKELNCRSASINAISVVRKILVLQCIRVKCKVYQIVLTLFKKVKILTFLGCGYPRNLFYIVGGDEASAHSMPWVSALLFKDSGHMYCGASLINEQFALTASHCVVFNDGTVDANDILIKLGAHHVNKDGKVYEIAEVIPHENYRPWKYYNDIALLKLAEKVEYDENIGPVCLPTKDTVTTSELVGKSIKLAGWGTTSYEGSVSESLQTTNVPIVSNEECQKNYSTLEGFDFAFHDGINSNFICAGYEEGGKDTCQGDSGGPMMLAGNDTMPTYQVGVVSFGFECAKAGYPGVYTSVPYHLGWIGTRLKIHGNS
ncbi:clotting factor B-like protein [Leptotrombidium deliense]|uniref:Clotting factor B-like protein n=1 Tax=Leptotrombidium deliense TaxID=299467 RepID=A0A443SHC2_9ACAR|nr:clotting factor B-like protein [Leptotrombidium deliense]